MKKKETKESEQKDSLFESLENEEDLEKKKKREVIFEMALFFVLGVLLGITIKTEAVKRITIGFNDYQISSSSQKYDVKKMKENLEKQMEEAQQQAEFEAAQQQAGQNNQ